MSRAGVHAGIEYTRGPGGKLHARHPWDRQLFRARCHWRRAGAAPSTCGQSRRTAGRGSMATVMSSSIDTMGILPKKDWQLPELHGGPILHRQATLYPQDTWDHSLGGTLGATAKDGSQAGLDAMDAGGVSSRPLPHWWPGYWLVRAPDFAVRYARPGTISWSKPSRRRARRLKGSCWCRSEDVSRSVKELRRAVQETVGGGDAVGSRLRQPLGHQDYRPFYAEAEKLDRHGWCARYGTGAGVSGPGPLTNLSMMHTLSTPAPR